MNGSLTRLTVNSLVAMMFSRVSSGFCDVTANDTLRRGGLCATFFFFNHEMDDYVTRCGEEYSPPARNSCGRGLVHASCAKKVDVLTWTK